MFQSSCDAVGDRGHQHLAEAGRPGAVVVFRHQPVRVAARVGGVIVGAVVHDGPVHELEMAVAADRVQVEEIHRAHLAQAQFQAPDGNRGGERQRIARGLGRLLAQRNGVVQHHSRDVRSFAQRWVANHVHVGETGDAERIAESGSAGAFDDRPGFRDSA